MASTYNVIDADGHILEPLDLWDNYIDPEFRERRPQFVIDENGKERLSVEGKLLGNPRGIGSLGSVGVRQGAVKPDSLKYAEGKKGGFDPHARIVDMDADGIDAAFLYPSLGLFAGAVEDPELAAAMCRAYNRWLADYCKPYPDRLFGVAMLPMQSVDLDYPAHASGAAQIAVDDDPVFGHDFGDQRSQSFEQGRAVANVAGQHAATGAGVDRFQMHEHR